MRPKALSGSIAKYSRGLVLSALTLLAVPSAQAIVYYWDDNAATAGFGTAGASTGTWAAPTAGPTAGWSLSATGANAFTSFLTGSGDTLNFGNGATGLAAGTITVSGTVDAGNITFASGSGAIVLSGGTITLAGVSTITVNNASDTISSILAGAATSLTKAGAGTLTLSGANTYTGTTTINAGTVTLNLLTGSLSSSSALTFGGTGIFNMDNTGAGGALDQLLAALTFSAGDGTVQITRTAGQDQTITFSSLAARGVGATGNFVNTGGTNSATNGVILTSGVTANAAMGPGYFFNGGTANANYAFYDATGFVRGINWGGDSLTSTTAGGPITSIAYAQSTGNTAATIATGRVFTGLNFQNTTGIAQAVTITGAITTDGILRSGNGASTTTISGGTSTITTTTVGADLVIRTDMANDALTISTPIIANGASGLTKSGAGTLVLGGANTYTGQTYVNGGTLSISSNANLGDTTTAATLNLNGATLRTTASINMFLGQTFSATNIRALVISNGATINTDAGTTLAMAYGISGTGGLTKTGNGTMQLGANTAFSNTWTGGLTVNGGGFFYYGSQTLNGGSSNSQDGFINTSNVLTLGDATFVANAGGARFNVQSFSGLNLSSGDNAVVATASSGATMTLNLNAISRIGTGLSTLNVSGNGVVTTTTANTNSILGPWATFGSGTSTRYATGGGTIAGLTGTAATDGSGLGTDTTGTFNYALAAGGGTVPASVSANTIRYTGAAGTTAPGATLFQVNGLLNAGTGTWTIGSGALTIGSTNQLVVNTANAGITLSAPITGGGSTAIIKTNGGTLTLSGNSSSTYSGTTYFYNGTLSLGDGGALGTGSLVIGTPNSAAALSLDSTVANLLNANTNAQTWNTDFTFVGTNSLDLGNGTVTLAASRTVAINANTLTVGPIVGSGFNLTKTGNGTLALSGANTYTGNTTVTDGGLSLIYGTATSKLSDTGVLSLTRVAVTLGGTASHAEVVGSTTLNAGASSLVQSGGAAATLRMNTITRNVGGTINFGAASIADTDTSNNAGGILPGWATVGGNTWAVSASSAADTAITGLANVNYSSTAGTTANFDTLKAGGGITLASNGTVNSIRFARAGADTVTANGVNIIGSGGILVTSAVGNNALTITGGTSLTSGNGQDLIVHQYNTANTLTIATKITGGIGVTKAGPGTLILSGTNDYTGQTFVNGGTLSISSNANLGNQATGATLNLNAATLRTTANVGLFNGSMNTNDRPMVIGGGVTINVDAGTTLTTNGAISGTGGLTRAIASKEAAELWRL